MAKPFGVKHATLVLARYRDAPPQDYGAEQEFLDVLRRLPADLDDALVVRALEHDIAAHRVAGSQVTRLLTAVPARGVPPNPARWAGPVVRAMQKFPADPGAAYFLAALPTDEAAWPAYLVRLDTSRRALDGLWNPKTWTPARRAELLHRLAADAEVVAGARAAARLTAPSLYDGWWWLLAADGGAASMPLVDAFVAEMLTAPRNLDWLATDFAPLLVSADGAALRARLIASVAERNGRAPDLAAARALGVPALRFKVGLYADGGMPRIRLWVDGTRDPWFDARWNWDELVRWPACPPDTAPLDQLRAFLAACVQDGQGQFRTWELVTALRGADKARLVAFLTTALAGLTGPQPASAPLKKFEG